jgi:hypothetical protein
VGAEARREQVSKLDSAIDFAFGRAFKEGDVHRGEPTLTDEVPSFGPALEVDVEPTTTTTEDTRLPSSSELAGFQELFDLQNQQLDRVAQMNRESIDNVVTFLERLGFADEVMQRKQLDNMMTILERLGMVTPTESQPQPESPQPDVTQ